MSPASPFHPSRPSRPPGSPDRLERRLAAILSTDVQGYSRLMSDDDEQTVRTLIAYRALMTDCIQRYHGRVVDSPGDNLLAEFGSVVAAVQCAVTIQHELKEQNAQLSAQRQMVFRIGINLGDVIVEDERLYGEGVNIAARLEGLAEGGGICLSGSVYDQVQNKLDKLPFEYLGERTVKNIAQPVRVYRIRGEEPRLAPLESPAETPVEHPRQTLPSAERKREHPIVGRQAELEQLERYLAVALQGERQLVFVTGEPGIGKTTLVDTFLAAQTDRKDLWIGHGQCIEQYGTGEAYLPILEAINRLCQAPDGEPFISVLRQHAPTWLVQLPSLISEADREALQRQVQGSSQERMLRELAEALTVVTAEHGLVLVLEDLHWSDTSTLELLAYVARRQESAQLCIIGTYRSAEVQAHKHPLRGIVQELQARGLCQEIPVGPLLEDAINAYVTRRLGSLPSSEPLTEMIHRRTEGNPLFMVATLEYLTQQGLLVEEAREWTFKAGSDKVAQWVPENLRQLLEKQIDSLSPDTQRVLEAASVTGIEFSVASVASGLALEVEGIETQCSQLARQGHFLQEHGFEEWPDGTLGGRYRFLHALYQNVLYGRLSQAARVRLHRQFGTHKETSYGRQARTIAAELAVHFAQGRAYPKAVQYHYRAGANAVRRHAHVEAIEHFRTGLSFLEFLPDPQERAQQELALQSVLGSSLMIVHGYAAAEVEQTYLRVRELGQQLENPVQLFTGQYGLATFYLTLAKYQTASDLAGQLLQLSEQLQHPDLHVMAHQTAGLIAFSVGALDTAQTHLAQALKVYHPDRQPLLLIPATFCSVYSAAALWLQGFPDQAVRRAHEALQLAQDRGELHSLSAARSWTASVHIYRREGAAAQDQAQAGFALAQNQAFSLMLAWQTLLQGAARTMLGQSEEGISEIRSGLAAYHSTGIYQLRSWFLALLAEAYQKNGQPQEALSVLEDAFSFVQETGEQYSEAELYRLKGESLLGQESKSQKPVLSPVEGTKVKGRKWEEAQKCFQTAIEIAQQQQAKSWELRAALSLGRLWQEQGKTTEARQLLEDIYGWFTEGFETQDLQDAEALLRTLGSQIERNTSQGSETEEAVENGGAKPVEPAMREQLAAPVQPAKSAQLANPAQALAAPLPVPSSTSEQPSAGSAQQSPIPPQSLPPCIFRQEGEYWTVAFEGTVCRMKDLRGMHYLAQLLYHPNEEFHVLALAAGEVEPDTVAASTISQRQAAAGENDAFQTGFTDAGEMLDPQARAAYRKQVQDLQTELEEAQEFNDLGRVDRLQEELDFLSRELSQAVGLGGRVRKTNSPAERARSTVTKAIKASMKRIEKSHPALGQYLSHTVRTGVFCRYSSDPRFPITWQR